MKTRPDWNVNNQALAQVEESGELGDFSGMIKDGMPKKMFDILVKHYALQIKAQNLAQKDAETLLFEAVQNKEEISKFDIAMIK